ncbi:DUF7856 family protein [Haloarchaeobius sp. DT45]|uniref:DUF7856 family protein n=1 Tax=Haloarchaeobius sp. DT45 TaxID=3446116 RepID=UPI003F6BA333
MTVPNGPQAGAGDGTTTVVGDGWVRPGRAIDLRDRDLQPAALAAAIRGETVEGLSVHAPTPGPVHEHVALVGPEMGFSLRQALAAVARARGMEPPQSGELREVEAALGERDEPTVDLETARRQVADASAEEDRLREQVATLQGELRARREVDARTDETETALRDTLLELTDVETGRIAAEQTLAQVRRTVRASRDDRERTLRLVDRRDNLRRQAAQWLATQVTDEFVVAVDAIPNGAGDRDDEGMPGSTTLTPPANFDGDPVTAALAVVRLAPLHAPVVLTCDRFDSPAHAARVLDAPVVIV